MDNTILLLVCIIIALMIVLVLVRRAGRQIGERGQRRAGKAGENEAAAIIGSVLNDDDYLLRNVELNEQGRRAEFDDIVVNRYGVFIIEVKNYSGRLRGREDSAEWEKSHVSSGGNVYEKTVRNPIGQVKREIDILARFLRSRGVNVWVEGYVYLVEQNSPVRSSFVLESPRDIQRVLHTVSPNGRRLSERDVKMICRLLG